MEGALPEYTTNFIREDSFRIYKISIALTIEELPELSEMSTVAIQILLEDKHRVLLVKLLIRNRYLLDYRIHKCAQCHSPKRADKPENQLISMRQKTFVLIRKNTTMGKNTRNRWRFGVVWQCVANYVVIDQCNQK